MNRFDLSRLSAWRDLPFFDAELSRIDASLADETRVVLPPAPQVFRALERTQPDAVRVVILGQDPYPAPGKADGLAFSIPQGFGGRLASLGNILRELHDDLGTPRLSTDLTDWADQGVLLLNTALTVAEGAPQSHARLGWSALVGQILERLSDRPRAYLLWGAHAQAMARSVPAPPNLKIETAHPSPLSARRGFFGARPFSRTNVWLQAQGMGAIDWAGKESQ